MKHILLASRHSFPPHSRGGGELCALELLKLIACSFGCGLRVLGVSARGSPISYAHQGAEVSLVEDAAFEEACAEAFERPGLVAALTYLEGTAGVVLQARRHSVRTGLLIVDRGGVFDGLSTFPTRPAVTIAISQFLGSLAMEHFGVTALSFPPPIGMPAPEAVIGPRARFSRRMIGMVNPNLLKGGVLFGELSKTMPGVSFLAVRGWSYPDVAPDVSLTSANTTVMDWTEAMDTFYDRLSVLVVPSLCPEGFGRVVREAMLRGIPVVGSNRGAIAESGCRTIRLLDPTKIEQWRSTLRELLSNFDLFDAAAKSVRSAATAQQERDAEAATRAARAAGEALGL